MSATPQFLFATCQVQAEPVLKREIRRKWPSFRFAYSRPGFLTFKLPDPCPLKVDSDLGSLFARSWGFSLGKATGETVEERLAKTWELANELPGDIAAIHVWERDRYSPGYRDYEPGISTLAMQTAEQVRAARPTPLSLIPVLPDLIVKTPPVAEESAEATKTKQSPAAKKAAAGAAARGIHILGNQLAPGVMVLDIVIVEPGEWWIGYHMARGIESSWPGGLMPAELPPHAVSRGYLKMSEALLWSGLPVAAGETCVDLGSSPGGAAQALLDRGLRVIGVDPAEMHPDVLAHPNFVHERKRSKEVKRRLYFDAKWVTTDINLPPNYTLDTLEGILEHPSVKLKGLLFTLKLPDWELVKEIPEYLARVREWGFPTVRARQLQHNRQEICVTAYGLQTKTRAVE